MVQTQLTLRSAAHRPPGRGRRGQLRPPSQGSAHAPQAVHLQRRRRDRPAARRGARPWCGRRQLRHGAPAWQLPPPGASRSGSAQSAAHAFRIVCAVVNPALCGDGREQLAAQLQAARRRGGGDGDGAHNTYAPKPPPPPQPPPHSVSNSNQVLMFRSLHNTARAFRNTVTEAPSRPISSATSPATSKRAPRDLRLSSPRPPLEPGWRAAGGGADPD